MERQDCAMAQHQRSQNLPAILLLENPCLRSPYWLVPVLCGMGALIPACAARLSQRSGLEQCVCDSYCGFRGGSRCGAGTGHRAEEDRRAGRWQRC